MTTTNLSQSTRRGDTQAFLNPSLRDSARQVPCRFGFSIDRVAGGAAAVPITAGMGVMVGDSGKVYATISAILTTIARMRRLVRIDKCEDLRLHISCAVSLTGWIKSRGEQKASESAEEMLNIPLVSRKPLREANLRESQR